MFITSTYVIRVFSYKTTKTYLNNNCYVRELDTVVSSHDHLVLGNRFPVQRIFESEDAGLGVEGERGQVVILYGVGDGPDSVGVLCGDGRDALPRSQVLRRQVRRRNILELRGTVVLVQDHHFDLKINKYIKKHAIKFLVFLEVLVIMKINYILN